MRNLVVDQLTRPLVLRSPWPGEEFALLLVVRTRDVTAEEQLAFSRQVVEQACRYAVCTGTDPGSWDDSIDHAAVEAELHGQRSESRTVMTSWHEGDPLEDVVDFFLRHTAFEDFTPSRGLALQLGGTQQQLAELEMMLREMSSGRTHGCN